MNTYPIKLLNQIHTHMRYIIIFDWYHWKSFERTTTTCHNIDLKNVFLFHFQMWVCVFFACRSNNSWTICKRGQKGFFHLKWTEYDIALAYIQYVYIVCIMFNIYVYVCTVILLNSIKRVMQYRKSTSSLPSINTLLYQYVWLDFLIFFFIRVHCMCIKALCQWFEQYI